MLEVFVTKIHFDYQQGLQLLIPLNHLFQTHGMSEAIQYYFPCPPYFVVPNFSYPQALHTSSQINDGFPSETNPFTPPATQNASLLPSLYPSVQLAPEPLKTKKKQTQRSAKSKMIFQDEDYRPDAHSSKKKGSMKQIQNRNIIPNVIRLILSFIQKKGKSEVIVEKLLKKWGSPEGISLRRFYLYQGMVKNLLSSYVNEETLRFLVQDHHELMDIYGEEQQRFYNRITRTLIAHFIREDFYIYLMTSKRMNREKKYLHVNALRSILDKIKTLLQSQIQF